MIYMALVAIGSLPQDLNLDLRNEHSNTNHMSQILKLTTNTLGLQLILHEHQQ